MDAHIKQSDTPSSLQLSRVSETATLSDGWMKAKGELAVVEDALSKALSDIDRIERLVEAYVGGEYEAQGCAAEHILDDIRAFRQEPCDYCGPRKYTGLPGGACENCMNTGLKYPPPETRGRK